MSCCRDIRGAFALLTVVPLASQNAEPTPRVAAWFPWVGLVVGGVALVPLTLVNAASVIWGDGRVLERAAWPLAVLVVGAWALLTRLLHWDGLADVADAWWGGSTPARRLEIMADSHVGAFGATAIALVAFAQTAAIAVLIGQVGFGIAVFSAPVFGRAAATFGAWLGTPARPGGLGARIMGRPTLGGILIAALALGLAADSMLIEHGVSGVVWSAGAFLLSAVVPHVLSRRFGGVTGDVLGASVLVTETVCLLAAALVVTW